MVWLLLPSGEVAVVYPNLQLEHYALTATAQNTAGGQDERRCKYTPPGFPPPTGWLGFNASGAPDTATGLSRHGREDARETRGEGHGRRHVRVALGSEQAAASIFFFSFSFW